MTSLGCVVADTETSQSTALVSWCKFSLSQPGKWLAIHQSTVTLQCK